MKTRAKLATIFWIYFGILCLASFTGCMTPKASPPRELTIRIESEIPVTVSVYKSCKDNWNFCRYQ